MHSALVAKGLGCRVYSNDPTHFEVVSNNCGRLAPGESCTVGVLWYDELLWEEGKQWHHTDARLTITDDLGQSHKLELRATGIPFGPPWQPSARRAWTSGARWSAVSRP